MLFSFECSAQSFRISHGINKVYPGSSPQEMAMNYITDQWQLFNFNDRPEVWLRHTKTQNMQSGHVVRHRQYYRGLRVDKNEITIKIDRNDRIRIALNSTFPINQKVDIKPAIDDSRAFDIVQKHLGIEGNLRHRAVELMIHVQDQIPHLSYQVNVIADHPTGDWEAYVDARSGEVLQVRDKTIYCFPSARPASHNDVDDEIDSRETQLEDEKLREVMIYSTDKSLSPETQSANGTGYIFDPNPVVSAMTAYGTGDYIDNSDATNSTLDAERMSVTLQDIEYYEGMYRLKGDYAEIIDIDTTDELYEQSSPDFLFNRSQDAFEAVMCYYYIDKSMRYVNQTLGVSVVPYQYFPDTSGVRFDPHSWTVTNAGKYNSTFGQLQFGDETLPILPIINVVDGAEDAFLILHELGHGLHNWLAGDNYSIANGLSEGLGDYWGQSSTRPCGRTGLWDEWDDRYHQVFHWAGAPRTIDNAQRITNFNDAYDESDLTFYEQSQHMSTVLMRIRSDLGRLKTDLLVIESMPMLVNPTPPMTLSLQDAADMIFETAGNLAYSDDEQCIVYQHLSDRFDIPSSAPSGGTGDIYIKDAECDIGEEPNINSMVWGSRDIWVRNTNDGLLDHQNPDFSQNPNYVYVRVRGNGCLPVTDASLSVYFSKASTSLQWPAKWVNYYVVGPSGPVLAGDLIETTGIEEIKPGHEQIIEIEWNVPNPYDFNTTNHFYCLLARIVSASDPMVIYETPDMMLNAQNNNVALKNMTLTPYETPPMPQTPNSLYLGCDPSYGNGQISLSSAIHPLNKSVFDYGEIYIELMEPLKSNWILNGKQGAAFALQTDGRIKVLNESFTLDNLPMSNCENLVIEVTFEPFADAKVCAFDVIQHDSQGNITGGERFEYHPDVGQPQAPALIQIVPSGSEKPGGKVHVFPNPVNYEVNIRLNQIVDGRVYIEIYSASGRLLEKSDFSGIDAMTQTVSVESLSSGVYFVRIYSERRDIDEIFKMIRQ